MIPYSKNLQLRESEAATYQIYILTNPINNEVFYVGKTAQELKTRLSGHNSDMGKENAKGKYLKEMFDNGGARPLIECIDTIECVCYLDKLKAGEREFFWMKYYKEKGAPLTNYIGIETSPTHLEYESYRSHVDNQQCNLKFYYCGRTIFGINVFDEEKMNEDGFILARNNLDMLITMPTEDDYKDPITYEKVYDDDNETRSSYEEM